MRIIEFCVCTKVGETCGNTKAYSWADEDPSTHEHVQSIDASLWGLKFEALINGYRYWYEMAYLSNCEIHMI